MLLSSICLYVGRDPVIKGFRYEVRGLRFGVWGSGFRV